jgi:hypothetical protein
MEKVKSGTTDGKSAGNKNSESLRPIVGNVRKDSLSLGINQENADQWD